MGPFAFLFETASVEAEKHPSGVVLDQEEELILIWRLGTIFSVSIGFIGGGFWACVHRKFFR